MTRFEYQLGPPEEWRAGRSAVRELDGDGLLYFQAPGESTWQPIGVVHDSVIFEADFSEVEQRVLAHMAIHDEVCCIFDRSYGAMAISPAPQEPADARGAPTFEDFLERSAAILEEQRRRHG